MIGTTRSRVSFFMNKFRKLGFIDYNGTLRVHSSLLNIVLHDWGRVTSISGLSSVSQKYEEKFSTQIGPYEGPGLDGSTINTTY